MGLLDLKGAVDEAAVKLQPLMEAFLRQLPTSLQEAVDGLTVTVSRKEPPKETTEQGENG